MSHHATPGALRLVRFLAARSAVPWAPLPDPLRLYVGSAVAAGLVEWHGDRLRLTATGWDRAAAAVRGGGAA